MIKKVAMTGIIMIAMSGAVAMAASDEHKDYKAIMEMSEKIQQSPNLRKAIENGKLVGELYDDAYMQYEATKRATIDTFAYKLENF